MNETFTNNLKELILSTDRMTVKDLSIEWLDENTANIVTITFNNGHKGTINVFGDSQLAIIQDVTRYLAVH